MKAIIFIALMLIGCAPARQLTSDEKAYRDKAYALGGSFTVPTNKASEIWGRAQAFVGQHSTMKLQTVSDYVIQTYTPIDLNNYGYQITRAPNGDSTKFIVTCSFFERSERLAILNACVCAYYMATGEQPPQYLITQ